MKECLPFIQCFHFVTHLSVYVFSHFQLELVLLIRDLIVFQSFFSASEIYDTGA